LAATLIAAAVVALVVQKKLWRAGSAGVSEASAAEVATGGDSIALAKAALAARRSLATRSRATRRR
jgi:hypothetical protein